MTKKALFLCLTILIALPHPSQAYLRKQVPQTKQETQLSFAPLVKKTAPAVVNIYTKRKVTVQQFSPFLGDPVFKHFFGRNFPGGKERQKIESSLGSGVIVKHNGYIITSNHVISGSDEIRVALWDRREFDAKVIITDKKSDLALLKIDSEGEKLPALELMDSDRLEVGDLVLAIGNPFGVGQTVTSGIVSALARTTIGLTDYQFFIQTDAAINPGNSGGALINMEGKLVGVNTAIFSRSGGSHGIGFAIPSNMVASVIDAGLAGGRVRRPWLGVQMQPVTGEVAASLGLERPEGALVSQIHAGGPIEKAGVKVGDIVLSIDDHVIHDPQSLHFRVATYEIGSKANLKILRNGRQAAVDVEMLPPPETPKRDSRHLKGEHPFSGAKVANLSPALADELGLNTLQKGVIILELKTGTAMSTGFKPKDIVLEVNGNKVTSTKQLENLLASHRGRWKVSVQRGKRVLSIIIGGR